MPTRHRSAALAPIAALAAIIGPLSRRRRRGLRHHPRHRDALRLLRPGAAHHCRGGVEMRLTARRLRALTLILSATIGPALLAAVVVWICD